MAIWMVVATVVTSLIIGLVIAVALSEPTKKRQVQTAKEAVVVLAGYCEKHPECKNCSFCYAPSKCFLEDCNPPCDWSAGRLLEWKGSGT